MSTDWWNDEDFSLLTADGSETSVVDEMVRPYPRAVAGTIDAFAWDRAALSFSMSVSGSALAGSDAQVVSEIYLPTRHLGPAPAVTLTGACHRWLADAELLLVHAHEQVWRLTVEPTVLNPL